MLCCRAGANCERNAGPLICHSSPPARLCQFHAAAERDSDEPLRRPCEFENVRALHAADEDTNRSVKAGMETPATGAALCLFVLLLHLTVTDEHELISPITVTLSCNTDEGFRYSSYFFLPKARYGFVVLTCRNTLADSVATLLSR